MMKHSLILGLALAGCAFGVESEDFLPADNALAGWTRVSANVYTDTQSFFNAYDGGIAIYLRYGLKNVADAQYTNGTANMGIIVYYMQTSQNAKTLFDSLHQGNANYVPVSGIGDSARLDSATALWSASLEFIQGSFLCRITVNKNPASLLTEALNMATVMSATRIETRNLETGPLTPQLIIYPAPATSSLHLRFTLPREGSASALVTICDSQGRLVRQYRPALNRSGNNTLVWDRRDSAGRTVAAGQYLVQVMAGEQALRQVITVLK